MKDHEWLAALLLGVAVGALVMFMAHAPLVRRERTAYARGYAAAVDSVRSVPRFVPYRSPGAHVASILDAYGRPYQFLVDGSVVVTVGWMDAERAKYDTTDALPVVPR